MNFSSTFSDSDTLPEGQVGRIASNSQTLSQLLLVNNKMLSLPSELSCEAVNYNLPAWVDGGTAMCSCNEVGLIISAGTARPSMIITLIIYQLISNTSGTMCDLY